MSEAAKPGALTDTEREVSQRLSQGFAWPTVLLLVALIAIEGAVIAAWAGGAMPLLLGMFINSLACYGLYTVVHDSVHKSVSNRDPKYARWDTICGNDEHADRFGNTRITLFPGSAWLLLQRDRHLIHHLYPSIPRYRYRAAHRELASLLRERGAVVAGPSSDLRVRVQLR